MKTIKENLKYTPVIFLLIVTILNFRSIVSALTRLPLSFGGILGTIATVCPLVLLVFLFLRERINNGKNVFGIVAIVCGVAMLYKGFWQVKTLLSPVMLEQFVDAVAEGWLVPRLTAALVAPALIVMGMCVLRGKEIPVGWRVFFWLEIIAAAFCSLLGAVANIMSVVPNFVCSSLYLYAVWSAGSMFNNEIREERKMNVSKATWLIAVVIGMFLLYAVASGSSGGRSSGGGSGATGYWGSDGYYHPSDKEMENVWNDVNNWMANNW